MKFLSNTRILLLVLWLGAAVFFSFAAAPGAFAVLRAAEIPNYQQLAGSLVQRNLMIVNLSGLAVGLLLLLTSFVNPKGVNKFLAWVERILLAIVAAACGAGHFVIGLWISFLRTEIGRPMDELALDDPLKVRFDALHEYSVWILVTAMIAALLAFVLISSKDFSALSKTSDPLDFKKDFKF
ncbi:MAG: DUF4149 domain-containing protein [Acidobacteria bacterium]|nr:DUF4149 domain-containing protein [Acidobacteriota bacterium]